MKKMQTAKKWVSGMLAVTLLFSGVGTMTVGADESSFEQKLSSTKETRENPLRIWYDQPASKGQTILSGGGYGTTAEDNQWQQFTLPIGNSYMGANVYGELSSERLTFNHKTLWNGGSSEERSYETGYTGGNKEVASNGMKMSEVFKKIGELFLEGKDSEASSLCDELTGDSDGYGSYQSWGDIYLDFNNITDGTVPADYNRDLDLTTGIANVDFTQNGTKYHREYFISYADQVVAMKLTADGGETLDFNVSFPVDNAEGVKDKNLGKDVTYTASNDTLITKGKLQDNQMKMNSMLKVVPDANGSVSVGADQESLDIKDASSVVIYMTAATDYKNEYPDYRTGETDLEVAARVKQIMSTVEAKGYENVKAAHLEDYQEMFERVDLELGQGVSEKPVDKLLDAYKKGTASEAERAQLEVLLYQYGRYLTIASSREGDLPANLQGVWQNRAGDSERVPWGSDYHINVNLQMNYWPTYSANLAECAIPLIDFVDSLREPGRVTANTYFGIESKDGEENGFTAHTQTTPLGWTCPGWSFSWGWSPAAVPWILQNCWEYYEYTGDKEFMEQRIYPMLKEEAKLYDQLLVDSGMKITLLDGTKSTRLVSVPTYSPEHGPYTMGNAYEQELIWQLYEDTIIAAETLSVDEDLVEQWKATQARLAPIEIGDSGQIKEWYTETTLGSIPSEREHRHISHLLGLFPGDLISVDNDEYLDAAIVSLKDRGMKSTGWGMGQRINSWARVGDGNQCYQLIETLFQEGIYPNLWDSHPPFQIDGNFGYTSGVNEMLMQSNMGYINILPALPDAWNSGSVDGIVARGNFEVGIEWEEGMAEQVTLLSKNGGECSVQYLGINKVKVENSKKKSISYTISGNNRITFDTEENETYVITGFSETPEAPVDGEAFCMDAGEIELAWKEIAVPGITYNVYRKAGSSYEKIAEGLQENKYTDTSVTGDVENMKYKLTSVLDGIESAYSQMIQISDLTVAGMIDDSDPRVVYTGNWSTWEAAKHYGGGIHYVEDSKIGDDISLVFVGTGIRVITPKNKEFGIMDVFIDDEYVGEADLYNPNDIPQQLTYEVTDLDQGRHTITLKSTERHNPSSSKAKLEFDAFEVIGDEYTITFASDKGEGTLPAPITYYIGGQIKLPESGLTLRGYKFLGWTDGEDVYPANSYYKRQKEDITLDAVWEKEEYVKIPSQELTATADSEEDGNSWDDGPASWSVDGNESSHWHSNYNNGVRPDIPNDLNNSITIDMGDTYPVSKFEYVPRGDANGRILGYKLFYSTTENGDDFIALPNGEGSWTNNTGKKEVVFTPINARRIQLRAMETAGSPVNTYISAAEFYLYYTVEDQIEPECTCAISDLIFANQSITVGAEEEKTVTLEAEAVLSGNCEMEGHAGREISYTYEIKADTTKEAKLNGNLLTVSKSGQVTVKATAGIADTNIEASKEAIYTVTVENPDDKKDQEAAKAVEALIANIGTVSYSNSSRNKIHAARKAYNTLSNTQKKLVQNRDVLERAEAQYDQLEEKAKKAKEIKQGKTYTVGKYKYKVTDLKKKTVKVVGVTNKKIKTIKVKEKVKIKGKVFHITSIGTNAFKNCKEAKKAILGKNVKIIENNAFYGCRSLKQITIKGGKITTVKKKAFRGIKNGLTIKVPAKKVKYYKNLLKNKGLKKTVKIK